MGRQFSETERVDIRRLLIEKGKELFGARGLKKTTVEDITREVGIAQGSFYAFFDSKEELYFEILEMEEKKLWESLRSHLGNIQLDRKGFKDFLFKSLDLIHENPFIRDLVQNDSYSKLLGKVPPSKMGAHLEQERAVLTESLASYQREGTMKKVKPHVLAGLFHALFLLYLHKEDIGVDIFRDVVGLMLDLTSDGLINRGDRNLE
jgi:AcrR family transcriptional regulator